MTEQQQQEHLMYQVIGGLSGVDSTLKKVFAHTPQQDRR